MPDDCGARCIQIDRCVLDSSYTWHIRNDPNNPIVSNRFLSGEEIDESGKKTDKDSFIEGVTGYKTTQIVAHKPFGQRVSAPVLRKG